MMNTLTHCLAYLDQLPPAISGSGGHNATFRAACECVRFGLTDAEALEALRRYNARCRPPWSERELRHKLDSAKRKATSGVKGGPRYRPQPVTPRTAAQLAERTARRTVPRHARTPLAGTQSNNPSGPNVAIGHAPGFPLEACGNDPVSAGRYDGVNETIHDRPSPVVRWQGDFLDFLAECHSGAPLRMELAALWQSYHAWCARSAFAPMPAGDFAEWLHTTCSVSRDEAGRHWVLLKYDHRARNRLYLFSLPPARESSVLLPPQIA